MMHTVYVETANPGYSTRPVKVFATEDRSVAKAVAAARAQKDPTAKVTLEPCGCRCGC